MMATLTSKGTNNNSKGGTGKTRPETGRPVRFKIDEAGQVAITSVLYSVDDLFGFDQHRQN